MTRKPYRLVAAFCGAVLFSIPAGAALIDFENLALGSQPSAGQFGDVNISTRYWVTDGFQGPTIAESFTRGVIDVQNGSQSVVVVSQHSDADGLRTDASARRNIQVNVNFASGVSGFAVDVFSEIYSSALVFSGFNSLGEAFQISTAFSGAGPGVEDFTHLSAFAPEGGYITGFYFSQWETSDHIRLAMDNLDYTSLAGIDTRTATVPEAGSSAMLLGIGVIALGAVRRWIKS